MSVREFEAAPKCESHRLIRFDRAEIVETNPPTLVVSGEAPCLNMEVALQPRVYIRCPEYWGIEVVGCLPGGFCLTAMKPFRVTLSLAGIVGSEGIEVVGADGGRKIEVTGGCSDDLQYDFTA